MADDRHPYLSDTSKQLTEALHFWGNSERSFKHRDWIMFLFSPCYTGYISRFQFLGVNFYFLGATTWQKYVLPFYMQKPLSIHSREATHTFCNGCTVKGNVTLYVCKYIWTLCFTFRYYKGLFRQNRLKIINGRRPEAFRNNCTILIFERSTLLSMWNTQPGVFK